VAAAWWEWRRERGVTKAGNNSKLREFFIGGPTRRIMLSNFLIIMWFSWFCVINSRHESLSYYVMGVLIIGAAIQAIARRLDAPDLDWQAIVIIGLCGLALTFDFVWERRFMGRYFDNYKIETIASSIALGAYLAWRVMSRNRGSGLATIFFCLLIIRWYFDMFFDFMDKGVFFLVGGAILVILGIAYAKWNKRRRSAAAGGGDGDE
jgi:uncharacterized membrane protein